jgi:hypothetical protein
MAGAVGDRYPQAAVEKTGDLQLQDGVVEMRNGEDIVQTKVTNVYEDCLQCRSAKTSPLRSSSERACAWLARLGKRSPRGFSSILIGRVGS